VTRSNLRHAYWIGGGSGSGKSQVAQHLAAEFGLQVYETDEAMADHIRRMRSEEAPALAAFLAMDMDERWVEGSPEAMLDTLHWFRGEGFGLLPHLVQPLLADPKRAVWLLPTPELRYAAFTCRGSLWAIAGRTSDPDKALSNLLERDRLFTERLASETQRLGLRAISICLDTPENRVTDEVAAVLGLS